MPYVIGTAGHIDHGKTALVRALTGQDTDRLKEEKERGISIDLGFAHLDLPDGTSAGVVDVPGHERFIRNMLAGAHGIDLALVVVAADDGVMPQTEEHLDIVRLLGIGQAIFVVSKADLASPERLAEVEEEIGILALDTPYEGAPLLAVSARTGAGLAELREAIAAALARLAPARAAGYFRLPVDRAFVRPGHGLVITGTALSGEIAVGERVRCAPGGDQFRVRGIQVHGQPRERAGWGQRVALNLAGADSAAVKRGHVVSHDKLSVTTTRLDAFVEIRGGGGKPIRNHARLRMYLGTAEHLVKLAILGGASAIEPRQSAYCQLALREPVLAMRGDRFILRDEAAQRTLGGGVVVHPWAARHRRGEAGLAERLETLRTGDAAAVARIAIDDARALALPVEAVAQFLNARAEEARSILKAVDGLRVIEAEGEKLYVAQAKWRRLEEAMRALLAAFHAAQPLAPGMDMEELRGKLSYGLSPQLFRTVVNLLAGAHSVVRDESVLRLPGHRVEVGEAEKALMEKIRAILARDPMAPPDLREIEKETGAPPARLSTVLRLMEKEGSVVRVGRDMVFPPQSVEHIRTRFAGYLAENGEITAAGFRDLIGSTRKYVIPLLEYFDRTGLTVRVGDMRRLKRPAAALQGGAQGGGK